MPARPWRLGTYRGEAIEPWSDPASLSAIIEAIESLRRSRASGPAVPSMEPTPRLTLTRDGHAWPVAVKRFPSRSRLHDAIARRGGSPARRAWTAARLLDEHGVPTPAPIAFVERWERGRLVTSCYLSAFIDSARTFRDELIWLFESHPDCEALMARLESVAGAVRGLHDAGFLHGDLGNQNILLRTAPPGGGAQVCFVDLTRLRKLPILTDRSRARDLSRIYLPTDLRRIFFEMYWKQVPPRRFLRWERFYRWRYALHNGTRRIRHPIREWHRRRLPSPRYPDPRDMWIWDERSAQPINVWRPRDRNRHLPWARHARLLLATLAEAVPLGRAYQALMRTAFEYPVAIQDRIGLAIHPRPDTWERERLLLQPMGRVPLLIRFGCHEPLRRHDFLAGLTRELHEAGHRMAVALLQDRAAVRDPERWRAFVQRVLEQVGPYVEWLEVGHAVNRVKWGVWTFREYERLLEGAASAAAAHPGLRIMGPAVIDFDIPFLAAALRCLPEGFRLDAVSNLLYVDRRGAPENAQGPFSTLEKCALARAAARCCSGCEDRLIVSEVNWPLLGTGVYSPVTSPYESPGPRFHDPSVREDDYADYMVRYLLITLASGLVDRVYWWRLTARGFGLVDDTDPRAWRLRPAYTALQTLVRLVGNARFVRRKVWPSGLRMYAFETPHTGQVAIAYAWPTPRRWPAAIACEAVLDALGRSLSASSEIILGSRPVYFVNVRHPDDLFGPGFGES